MKDLEIYTLVNPTTGTHYDTLDERFYPESWDKTFDSKEYLTKLKNNNPDKFDGFEVVK